MSATMSTWYKKLAVMGLSGALLCSGLSACSSTTGTGAIGVNRNQLLVVSDQQVLQMAAQSYQQELQEARAKGALDTDVAQLNRLKRIASRLVSQVGAYRPDAQQWQWDVHTIKSNDLNAHVLPGGKVTFYTGIIDRLNLTDAEIAAIMGHEMAHALREHARERISQDIALQQGIGLAVKKLGLSRQDAGLVNMAGKLGLELPNSRTQETEADLIGLELMARAGYDPHAAISLWQKMQNVEGRGEPPQFLSTHPVSANRIANLQAMMPKVMPLYQQSKYR